MDKRTDQLLRCYGRVKEWTRMVEHCLDQLPERERAVLEGWYGGVSIEDLEFELSVSRSTVFRIKKRGISHIRHFFALTKVALFWDDLLEHLCYNRHRDEA